MNGSVWRRCAGRSAGHDRTLDGLGGWFVDGVDGDPSSVIGISLPLTRALLSDVGVSVVSLWPTPANS